MTYIECRTAWITPGGNRAAQTLDEAFPKGVCQCFSLASPERAPVPEDELIARILVSPSDYDLNENEIMRQKLTNLYGRGLSVVRAGASDDEILTVVDRLLSAQEAETLVGAIVIEASVIRNPVSHFCIYDTDAPGLLRHADIVGTFDPYLSASAWKKEMSRRRASLCSRMQSQIIFASEKEQLVVALRSAGI